MEKLCPKCAKPLDAQNYCEHCDLSISVYEKIINTSKILYNQGLQKAKVRDLSAAIDLLNRSIRLDKHNINARNLLGLIYFEIGETVTALQQWVVSKNLKPQDNEAVYFLNQVQDNQSYLDKLNQAIKKYNQSLNYIEQGSTDLAIIQLKKVISLNSKFVKAYALLALCYIKEKQVDKAQKILFKILSIDKSNYIARKYLDDIQSDAINSEDFEDKFAEDPSKGNGIAFKPVKMKINSAVFQFFAMVIGVAIGLSIMYFMVMPDRIDEKDREITSINSEVVALEDNKKVLEDEIAQLEVALDSANEESVGKDSVIAEAESKLKETVKVLKAIALYVSGEGPAAADALYAINQSMLSAEVLSSYQSVTEAVYPVIAEKAYQDGFVEYRADRFDNGIVLFETAYKYEKDAEFSDNALYFLARCYYKKGEIETAIPIFEKMLEEYPDATNKTDAQYFVNLHKDD